MEKEVIITSTLRHKIRLPLERWAHILESHDYMAGCVDLVVETVNYPDQLIESEWEQFVKRGRTIWKK
jgi:hypothetical protein